MGLIKAIDNFLITFFRKGKISHLNKGIRFHFSHFI